MNEGPVVAQGDEIGRETAPQHVRAPRDKGTAMKKLASAFVILAAVSLLLVGTIPASAAAGDAAVFSGTAKLPTFPDPSGENGSFSGTATGTLSGDVTASSFEYQETTCAEGTVTGQNVSLAGTPYWFDWTRVGATAAISVYAIDGDPVVDAQYVAVAAFVVTSSPAELAAACSTGPAAKVEALVAGVAVGV